MHFLHFEELKLMVGDQIFFINERGEGLLGRYEGGYEHGKDTFSFHNFGNGRTEIIYLSKIQHLTKA